MKNILIAATIVGAAAAGLILYLTSRSSDTEPNRVKNAASNAYNMMNEEIGKVERLGQHSMG